MNDDMIPQPCFRLLTVDGEDFPIKLREFFDDNEDLLGTSVETAVRGLAVGESFAEGGGAQPQWSIRRVS